MDAFVQRVNHFLSSEGLSERLDNLLVDAMHLGSREALQQVVRLAKDDYGGNLYKWEIKSSACFAVLHWKESGIQEIAQSIDEGDEYATSKTIIGFLSYVAAGEVDKMPHVQHQYSAITKLMTSLAEIKNESIKLAAKAALTQAVKKVEKEDKFPFSVLSALSMGWFSESAQEQIFGALIMRWFQLNPMSVDKYLEVITSREVGESECHKFLAANPYLIDPFYAEIWSKPRFGEKLQPDFVIRSIDNTYTVIEIEDPLKPILTKSGNLSNETNHAKRQALEYREWVTSNQLYAEKNFPSIWRPNAIVVIGMERNLDQHQRDRLKQENESTEGKLKVVGFDWIYLRAKATFENILQYGFQQRKI